MIKSLLTYACGLLLILGIVYYFAPRATKSGVKSAVGWVSESNGKGDEIFAP